MNSSTLDPQLVVLFVVIVAVFIGDSTLNTADLRVLLASVLLARPSKRATATSLRDEHGALKRAQTKRLRAPQEQRAKQPRKKHESKASACSSMKTASRRKPKPGRPRGRERAPEESKRRRKRPAEA